LVGTCRADGCGRDVEEDVAWENGGKETLKAKEEMVTGLGGHGIYAGWKVVGEGAE
jgi:hypothetical protein